MGKQAIKLPNAPLAEAVFELRWMVQPLIAYADPGFLPARDAFTKQAIRLGYSAHREMGGPQDLPMPHTITRRFFLAEGQDFPLLQIGPGIFASNQSSEYYWPDFKKQALQGIRALLSSYPSFQAYPFTPIHLELRYVDAFDASLVGTTDFVKFLETGTTMRIDLPKFLKSIPTGAVKGRLHLECGLRQWKSSQFAFDIASGLRANSEDILRLETKVITRDDGVPKPQSPQSFLKNIHKWMEFAHGITSPVFEHLISAAVMAKFKGA